jgi:parallel beta-helix repeat protein
MTLKSTVAIIVVCLLVLGVVCIQPIKAQYQGSLTINLDGSITPSTAPIQKVNNYYVLDRAWEGTVHINRSNALFDGNGHTLSGISISGSNITVKNCVIKGGAQFGQLHEGVVVGIELLDASNVTVANNTISEVVNFVAVFAYYETVSGIIVSGGSSNIISGNNLLNNWQGMVFSDSSNNQIFGNNITSNLDAQTGYSEIGGIYFDNSSNNTVYHNNFMVKMGSQAKNSYFTSVNFWDNGFPSGGNYWNGYASTEIDSSGIGNSTYAIDSNNSDRYPLIKPFNSTFYAMQLFIPEIFLLSPLNQEYSNSSLPLVFSVDILSPVKGVSWTGYGIDGSQNVTLFGNSTVSNLTNGVHSITIFANDTYGNTGSQTVNFSVEKPQSSIFGSTAIILVTFVPVAIICMVIGLLLYGRHRKGHLIQTLQIV